MMWATADEASGGGGNREGVVDVPASSCIECVMMSLKPASASQRRAL